MPSVVNFLDTNILVYAFSEGSKAEVAQTLMAEPFVLSVQTLNEFANVGRKRLNLSWERIEDAIDALSSVASAIVVLDKQTTKAALKLVGRYNLAFYDALMLTAALKADCSRYFSEDLQHGLLVDGKLTVVNPFR